jgi:hypothetical protein
MSSGKTLENLTELKGKQIDPRVIDDLVHFINRNYESGVN